MEHGSQSEVNFIHESRTGELTLLTFDLLGIKVRAHLVIQQTQHRTGGSALLFLLVPKPSAMGCMMNPESCFMKPSCQDLTSLCCCL